jgi:hypothetical protein
MRQRVAEWCNIFGSTAIEVVSEYFEDESRFATADEIATRVRYLLGAGDEIPWLWKNRFEPPSAGVVRRFLYMSYLLICFQEPEPRKGYYQSPFLLKTFAIHFGASGIDVDPTKLEMDQIGALSLAATAVSIAIFIIFVTDILSRLNVLCALGARVRSFLTRRTLPVSFLGQTGAGRQANMQPPSAPLAKSVGKKSRQVLKRILGLRRAWSLISILMMSSRILAHLILSQVGDNGLHLLLAILNIG